MRQILILGMITSCLFGCDVKTRKQKVNYFPKEEIVIDKEFVRFTNFMPLALVHTQINGKEITFPIVYVYFDSENKTEFGNKQDCDHFTFNLDINGKLTPDFNVSALEISNDNLSYFESNIKQYNKNRDLLKPLDFIDLENKKPNWWQGDETPKSKDGKECIFICQIGLGEIINDDCMMYVFYDPISNQIKSVYHRD